MSTVGRRERATRTVEFVVPAEQPWGACWTEIMLAIRMFPRDDAIVVVYERKEEA